MSHRKVRVLGYHQPFVDVGLDAPAVTTATIAPTTSTHGVIGDIYVNTTTGISYILVQLSAGTFVWAVSSAGSGDLDQLTGDGGTATPVAGIINLAGGTNLTTVAGGAAVTFNMDAAITLATSVASPIYTSAAALDINVAAGSDITIQMGDAAGANVIDFEDSGGATVATLDSDGTLTVVEMDGAIGANTPTTGVFTTATANTSVIAPLYTAGAGVDTLVEAVAGQDIVLNMADNAGATSVLFTDSDNATVFSVNSDGDLPNLGAITTIGAFTQTGGAVNIGMDNLGSAINIGGGNVIKALAIGGGAAAHTLALGGVNAGAMALDTAAGISLDSATASNFTVTGAADLAIGSTAGGLDLTSGEAAVDAISLDATNAAGGVTIAAGTNGILIGNQADCTTLAFGDQAPGATRTITIGGGTVIVAAVTDTIDIAPDGATTNANSIKTVNINAGTVDVGEVLTNIASGTVTSGTHTTEIATGNRAAGTMLLNVMTGTGTKIANLGNADAATTFNVDAIVAINTDVNAAVTINTGTATGATTIGSATAGAFSVDTAADFSINADDASTISVTAGTLDIDSTGDLSLNSSAGVLNFGDDDIDQAMNIGSAGERVMTIGNVQGVTAVNVNVGTGNFALEGNVASTYDISSTGVNTGLCRFASGTGARTVELAGGGTGIKVVNIAAAATADVVTIGTNTGAGSLTLAAGTGDITMTGTVKEVTSEFTTRSGDSITFTQGPTTCSADNGGGVATGATSDVNLLGFQEGIIMEQFVIGAAQTIIKPVMTATGLLVSGDLTNIEGYEYSWGATRANSRHSFTINTSPAFFIEWSFRADDISGLEPCLFGFRRTQAYQTQGNLANYTDFVGYGLVDAVAGGDAVIQTQVNTGGINSTDTNDPWADSATHTLAVLVSGAGVVTFTFDGGAPTATQVFSFDAGDVVHPFMRHEFNAAIPDAIEWLSVKVGFQA